MFSHQAYIWTGGGSAAWLTWRWSHLGSVRCCLAVLILCCSLTLKICIITLFLTFPETLMTTFHLMMRVSHRQLFLREVMVGFLEMETPVSLSSLSSQLSTDLKDVWPHRRRAGRACLFSAPRWFNARQMLNEKWVLNYYFCYSLYLNKAVSSVEA